LEGEVKKDDKQDEQEEGAKDEQEEEAKDEQEGKREKRAEDAAAEEADLDAADSEDDSGLQDGVGRRADRFCRRSGSYSAFSLEGQPLDKEEPLDLRRW
jgi:hypothetical protein